MPKDYFKKNHEYVKKIMDDAKSDRDLADLLDEIEVPDSFKHGAHPPRNDDSSDDEGNRKRKIKDKVKSRKKRKTTKNLRSRHWFLTLNNYTEDQINELLALGAKRYAFQEEKSASGTDHLQGVFSFQHAKFWSTLDLRFKSKAVWAVCRNVAAAKNYCTKEKTRNGRQWVYGYRVGRRSRKVKDPLEGKTLYNWQSEIIDMIGGEPDDRKIYWYWSDRGNIGKSALVKHLVMKEDAIFCGGRFQDAFYAIKEEVSKGLDIQIVIFDLPRSMGNKISYTAMEGIKNGLIFNSKYESGKVLFNTPHIIVLANYEPNLDQMSEDRWVVKNLDDEVL